MIRIFALAAKEALQLIRDRTTLGMLLGIPTLQIVLFGCAIELSPHSLDAAIVSRDPQAGASIEHLLASSQDSVHITREASLETARTALARGETSLVIDADARPRIAYVDAADPVLALYTRFNLDQFLRSISGPLETEPLAEKTLQIVPLFNPRSRTQPYLVSGLLGLILTMSLVMMGALTVARERERGTLEGLLALRLRPTEVWAGKLLPYLALAIVQAALILLVARFGFDIRPTGSVALLFVSTLVFAVANLALGFLFSCLARQQMQAMQLTFFFFLPSSLLSGFMFPFSAMPQWARQLAEALPLTHYLRIVRGLMLRGVDADFVLVQLVPIIAFGLVAAGLSLAAWRRTIA